MAEPVLGPAAPAEGAGAGRGLAAPMGPPGATHPAMGLMPAVQSLLTMVIVALFVLTFTVQPIRIPSESMEPTLLIGDFLLLDKQANGSDGPWWMPPAGVRRGDIAVFHDPVDDPSVHLIKRVVGVPGDTIRLRGGRVVRNGVELHEDYAVYRGSAVDPFRDEFPSLGILDARVNANWWIRLHGLVHDGAITVPAGDYFVMGDNRNDSEDSRYWGFVPREAIVGEPVLIYFSWREKSAEEGAREDSGRLAGIGLVPANRLSFARWKRIFQVVR